jgi:2-phospho-L-lactate transferase/gluconeogenesis factor (CofD/UPF0052 family)
VAVGGGHGQAVTLRAARRYARAVTAVVSVADDGGSSGRLRQDLGIVPPGDLRTCLVALAAEGSVLATAFEHRFPPAGVSERLDRCDAGDGDPTARAETASGPADVSVRGHALGNLILAGLLAATGDLQRAVDEAARLLGAEGRVVPVTDQEVTLVAETASGSVVGQTAVRATGGIRRVAVEPEGVVASPLALEAIGKADQVVLGPGSLYTSVLAAAAVPGVAGALAASPARKVYVANLRPEEAETAGYDVAAHVAALADHGIAVDVVVCDTSGIALGCVDAPVVDVPLARPNGLAHDPVRLADVLADLLG